VPILSWTLLAAIRPIPVGAFHMPWHRVTDVIRGPTHLLIAATGSWSAIPEVLAECGPNGFAGLSLPADRVVLPDAPPGALIGRFGGSSASLKADGAFPIGVDCVVQLPANSVGPLFVSINIVARPVDVASFTIEVSTATI
jgi:hypothetical protein